MRLSIFLLGLILIAQSSFTQISYTELERHNDSSIKILSSLDNGELIGFYDFPARLVKSCDNGDSWELFYEGSEVEIFSTTAWNTYFMLDYSYLNDELYFSISNTIYRYVSPIEPLEKIMHINSSINDFEFLNENEILIAAAIRDMTVYSFDGIKLRSYEFQADGFGIIDDQHFYAYDGNRIKRFDHDLNELGSTLAPTNVRTYANDRFYTYRDYSSDGGVTWSTYAFDANYIYAGHDGTVVAEKYNPEQLFLSTDGGETFNEISLPESGGSLKFWTTGDCNLIGVNVRGCETQPIYHTNDCGDHWLKKFNREAVPHAEKVIVGRDNNIIVGACRDIAYYKKSLNDPWEAYDVPIFADEIIALESGTFLASQSYRSEDLGASWQDVGGFYGSRFLQRGEKIFALDEIGNVYYTSEDDGITWDTIPLEFEPYDVMGSGTVYGFKFGDLVYSDDNGDLVYLDVASARCSNYIAAYDVDHIYVVRYPGGNSAPGVFWFTYDGGQTWNQTDFPFENCGGAGSYSLKTDRKGRLLMWGNQTVAVSYDAGLSWLDISPNHPDLYEINDVTIARDNHVYIAGNGTGILTSNETLEGKSSVVKIKVFLDEAGDCNYNGEEVGLENIPVKIGDSYTGLTDKDGEIELIVSGDSYDIQASFNTEFYASCNSSGVIR